MFHVDLDGKDVAALLIGLWLADQARPLGEPLEELKDPFEQYAGGVGVELGHKILFLIRRGQKDQVKLLDPLLILDDAVAHPAEHRLYFGVGEAVAPEIILPELLRQPFRGLPRRVLEQAPAVFLVF